jgi:hypothetical protein
MKDYIELYEEDAKAVAELLRCLASSLRLKHDTDDLVILHVDTTAGLFEIIAKETQMKGYCNVRFNSKK